MDFTAAEQEALKDCKKSLGEMIAEIGWDVKPSDWTAEQVDQIIHGVIVTWQERVPF